MPEKAKPLFAHLSHQTLCTKSSLQALFCPLERKLFASTYDNSSILLKI
jgi:hypothetical protein